MSAIDCRSATPNQRVSINKSETGFVSFSNKQTNSTPGVILANKELGAGRYRFSVDIKCAKPDTIYLLVSKGSLNNRVNPIQLLPATTDYTEFSVDFVSNDTARFFLCVFMQVPSSLDIEVSIKNAQLIDIDAEAEAAQPTEESSVSGRYVYTPHKKYGHNSFTTNLIEDYGFETLESDEALAAALSEGKSVMVHGLPNRVIALAKKHPKQIHSVWHSTIRGTSLMHEVPQYLDFIKLAKNGIIKGYWLSTQDSCPTYLEQIKLPIKLDRARFNNKATVDAALPLGSPHSSICKDLFSTIYNLLVQDLSFIATKWHMDSYRIEELKELLDSKSKVIVYEGSHNPIEPSYYASARVYICPSITDTMPYSVVEAYNAGVPTILSKAVGWYKLFCREDSKLYKALGEDFAATAAKLVDSKILRNRLYESQRAALDKASKKNKSHNTTLFCNSFPLEEEYVHYTVNAEDYSKLWEVITSQKGKHKSFGVESYSLVENGQYLDLHLTLSNKPNLTVEYGSKTYEDSVANSGVGLINVWVLASILTKVKAMQPLQMKNKTILSIDRKGWAFDNIATEYLNRVKGDCIKMVYPNIMLLSKIVDFALDGCAVIVFWWKSFFDIKDAAPNARVLTTMYDHYSWVNEVDNLKKIVQASDAVGYGNNKLMRDIKQATGVSHTCFMLKDGVNMEKFNLPNEPKEHSNFVIGWAGNSKIQASAGYKKDGDLKGFYIIKEAVDICSKSHSVEFLTIDVSSTEPIPHKDMAEKFFHKLDVLVCASESEGTPNPVFEALACGVPVVTTDVGNVADVVFEGFNGYIVDRTAEAVAAGIVKAMSLKTSNSDIRDSVSQFDWAIKVKPWASAINHLKGLNNV